MATSSISPRALVLGCGMQGRAVVHDLTADGLFAQVVCADASEAAARACAERHGHGKAQPRVIDASQPDALRLLMAEGFAVVVDMMPRQFIPEVVRAAIATGTHVVNTYYDFDLRDSRQAIADAGIAVLPEMGMDPGIDLVLYGQAMAGLTNITELLSFGGAIPTPEADDNPLRYKISWTWEGVLHTYARQGVVVRNGQREVIPQEDIFRQDNLAHFEIEGLGVFEGTPNGDAAHYTDKLGLTPALRKAGRYAVRLPGHGRIWHAMKQLGFLDDTPVPGLPGGVTPRQFLLKHLEPRLQYKPGQRDMVIIRAEAVGLRDGQPIRQIANVVDYADLTTGLTATARTVGLPAAIAARFLQQGVITHRGLLSPLDHMPAGAFLTALRQRGITVQLHSRPVPRR